MAGVKMIVDGFLFTEEQMAHAACQEADGIKYVRERLDMDNPRMVLEMYHKLLSKQVFETPVGLAYLKEIQNYLTMQPELEGEKIEPIKIVEKSFSPQQMQSNEVVPVQEGAEAEDGLHNQESQNLDWYVQKLEEAKQKERLLNHKRSRAEEKMKQSHKYLRYSLLGSLFLFIVATGMVVITMTNKNPNIINYENKIIEKYEAWETELENREQTLKEKQN